MTNLFSARKLAGIPALALAATAMLATGALPADAQGRREREHRPLPSVGEPGRIAAADLAFAKAMREEGATAALSSHATSSAVLHTDLGRVPAHQASQLANGDIVAGEWVPNAVWTSCDGSLAVSFGRYRSGEGIVGSYATVWELVGEREYKWSYLLEAPDVPQPPPPSPPPEVIDEDNTIVVPALGMIEGKVADCTRFADIPELRASRVPASISDAGEASRDGTLYYRWSSSSDGSRRIVVHMLRDAAWQVALDFGTGRWSESK